MKWKIVLTIIISFAAIAFYNRWTYNEYRQRIVQLESQFLQLYPNRKIVHMISGEGWSDYVEYYIYYTHPPSEKEYKTKWVMKHINGQWIVTGNDINN